MQEWGGVGGDNVLADSFPRALVTSFPARKNRKFSFHQMMKIEMMTDSSMKFLRVLNTYKLVANMIILP